MTSVRVGSGHETKCLEDRYITVKKLCFSFTIPINSNSTENKQWSITFALTINFESSPRSWAATTITKNAFFCRDTGSLVLAYVAIMALQLPTLIILSKSTQDWNDKRMANIEWSTSLIVTKQTHKLYSHYTQLCLRLVNSVPIYVGNQMLPVNWRKYLNYNIQDNTLLLQWGAKWIHHTRSRELGHHHMP